MKNRRVLAPPAELPNVYRYHDYRSFLRDWLEHQRSTRQKISLRALATKADLAPAHLSMVLNGTRALSEAALEKLGKPLGLSATERSYLELLRIVAETDDANARRAAMEKLERFGEYRKTSAREIEVYRYLTHWYYVAIREMATLPDFRADAEWIRKKLKHKVPTADIQTALDFLLANGFLEKQDDGSVRAKERDMTCVGGVYKLALAQFHREMLELAVQATETPPDERDISGYTFSFPSNRFGEVRELMAELRGRLRDLEKSARSGDAVFHVSLAAFPLSKKSDEGGK